MFDPSDCHFNHRLNFNIKYCIMFSFIVSFRVLMIELQLVSINLLKVTRSILTKKQMVPFFRSNLYFDRMNDWCDLIEVAAIELSAWYIDRYIHFLHSIFSRIQYCVVSLTQIPKNFFSGYIYILQFCWWIMFFILYFVYLLHRHISIFWLHKLVNNQWHLYNVIAYNKYIKMDETLLFGCENSLHGGNKDHTFTLDCINWWYIAF